MPSDSHGPIQFSLLALPLAAEVVLMAVRWYLRHPLSAASVMELLAERGIDVSKRTVLRWVQTFGPLDARTDTSSRTDTARFPGVPTDAQTAVAELEEIMVLICTMCNPMPA